MTPNFPETNDAIYYTSMYFKIGRVAEHLEKFGGGLNLSYLDSWYNITMRCHEDMEQEINQHIYGSKDDLKLHFFEYLKSWLDNWIFHPEQYGTHFESIITEANIKRTKEYEDKIIKKEDEFKLKVDYTKPHLTPLEIPKPKFELTPLNALLGYPTTRKNMWFFENTEKLQLIDAAYLPQYMIMLNEIIESFKSKSVKYVERFFSNKLSSSVTTILIPSISEKKLPDSIEPKLIESASSKKLKAKITVKELLYLFKALIDGGVIEHPPTLKTLHEIIAANFQTDRTDDMKVDKLQKWWSEIEATVAAYWEDKFLDLHKQSQKDNPNRLKPKK